MMKMEMVCDGEELYFWLGQILKHEILTNATDEDGSCLYIRGLFNSDGVCLNDSDGDGAL